MAKANDPRTETPLLRAYLRETDANPPYMIQWPQWASWLVFGILVVLIPEGFVLWIILAVAMPHIVRNLRRPRNEAERLQNETYKAIRRLKWLAADGRIRKQVAPEVLFALEQATEAHHAARTRLLGAGGSDAAPRLERLDASLHACFRIAAPMARHEEQSRREWETVSRNKALVAAVVDGIDAQRRRMEGEFEPDSERLAALRELESVLPTMPTLHL